MEKFGSGKQKDEQHGATGGTGTTITTGSATTIPAGAQAEEHEKKGVMKKIKEKFSGNHNH